MIKVNICGLWMWLLHLHALELRLCTNVLSSGFVLNLQEMSNHNNRLLTGFVTENIKAKKRKCSASNMTSLWTTCCQMRARGSRKRYFIPLWVPWQIKCFFYGQLYLLQYFSLCFWDSWLLLSDMTKFYSISIPDFQTMTNGLLKLIWKFLKFLIKEPLYLNWMIYPD